MQVIAMAHDNRAHTRTDHSAFLQIFVSRAEKTFVKSC
jgi:hypothetical protein